MAAGFNFTRLKRTITIYAIVQVALVGLLIFMALNFQAGLQAEGRPQRFLHSVVVALVIQVAAFYPLSRFASKEADRDVAGCAEGLSPEDMKTQRQKRIFSDTLKIAFFIFFFTLFYKMPQDRFLMCIFFFSFILTLLSYFQSYNFVARRLMKGKG